MLEPIHTGKFRKDYALAARRDRDITKLDEVMIMIATEIPLPLERRNHGLHGNWVGKSECHIQGDWVLIYRIDSEAKTVTFHRTGTHSDLFKK
ncbi:hypothetical protein AGMMS49546_37850 [Spirochaetia bacterium]|nr:hypothetical protein AGMMS49546_37850 [Spirochaetia bacterium]